MSHPFKRSTLRYGRSPEPDTPFRKPGQTWDTRIGSARVRAKNWRLFAFSSLGVAAVLTGTLVWLATSDRNVPYVVEIDDQGRARYAGPARTDYKPTDAQIAFHLAAFIDHVRSRPTDAIVLRQNWLKAYAYAFSRAAVTLNEYARANDPFANIGKRTVSVEAKSVVRASDNSFQMRWIERAYEGGALISTRHFSAILSVQLSPPRSAGQIAKNPLGIYVHTINWSEDLNVKGGQ